MYDRYMPPQHTFHPLPNFEDEVSRASVGQDSYSKPTRQAKPPDSDLLGGLTGGVRDFLSGLFEGFSLNKLDSGDILLILIILFLFLEGDNLDLVIALGLMLLLGLGEKEG